MSERTPTPICDFVRAYAARNPVRLHMPGHKGGDDLGPEPLDITEIDGADTLFEASGIIAESEAYASRHFGAHTFYSVEGSSLCIRAMLFLAARRVPSGRRARVLAARNVHKAFLSAAALLDLDVSWLYPASDCGLLASDCTPASVEDALQQSDEPFCAVYLTAPDYLGNVPDVAGIATVCHRYGVPLLVDNAHGAYLKFLPVSRHPIDLGADLCCDSAHKTLPALTGTAYLHAAQNDRYGFTQNAKDALALFGSTSPSYLLLQSLDRLNCTLDDCPKQLSAFVPKIDALKNELHTIGYRLLGDEPLKLTIDANAYGYTGSALKEALRSCGIEPEFADPDWLVLMLSPCNSDEELDRLLTALRSIKRRKAIIRLQTPYAVPQIACSIRAAMLSESEHLPVEKTCGRVLAQPCVSCPPAVPIVMCGEIIDQSAIERFRYYGTKQLTVLKKG